MTGPRKAGPATTGSAKTAAAAIAEALGVPMPGRTSTAGRASSQVGQSPIIEPGLFRHAQPLGRTQAETQGRAGTRTELTSTCHVRPLSPNRWRDLVDQLISDTDQATQIASGVLPNQAALHLTPDATDIHIECGCQSNAPMCAHARRTALALIEAIDTDPWVLVTLRGGVAAELAEAAAGRLGIDRSRPQEQTISPSQLWSDAWDDDATFADPAVDNGASEQRAPTAEPFAASAQTAIPAPPADSGLSLDDISDLVADAARRARSALDGIGAAPTDANAQMVELIAGRLSAMAPGRALRRHRLGQIAERAGLDPAELERQIMAWTIGGQDGLDVCIGFWDPPIDEMAPAARALTSRAHADAAATAPIVPIRPTVPIRPDRSGENPPTAAAKARRNRVTAPDGRSQLRLSQQGAWYLFVADDDLGWVMSAGPESSAQRLVDDSP